MTRKGLMRRIYELLKVRAVCETTFRLRFLYFTRVKRSLRSFEDFKGVLGHTHNLRALSTGRTSHRILKLIQPLAVIDKLVAESRILVIGCRFETDLLYLVGYGFAPANVRGLDMLSYSPWVDLGNMHNLPYIDDNWDAVVLGWTLAYSSEPERAASEIVRVTRDGGLVAIAVSYYPRNRLDEMERQGTLIGENMKRIQTARQMFDLFAPYVDRVYFNHDVSDPSKDGHCMVIFSVNKAVGRTVTRSTGGRGEDREAGTAST
ncbi:MAG: class I SAM-dependent methyltransferase [Gammaproteobacteria bacterium]